jgi:tetratricopeptide (TPR) repeat protein
MAAKTQTSAIQILEQKLKTNPQSRAFSRLADTYRLRGDVGQAVTLCLEGLAEHPNYVTGRLILGRCYAEQKNFQGAVEELKKVCVTDRRNHAALKMLADIFIKLGRSEEAGGLYRILFDMEPDNPNVKHLSAKHPSSIQGNIFDILGIQPISAASSVQNLKSSGIDEFADIQNMDTIQSEMPRTAVNAVHDNTSTILTADLLPAQNDEPTGSDIENQLDSMFGEISPDPIPSSYPAAALPQNSGADMFTAATDEPTGSDIENQLDSMFGSGFDSGQPLASAAEAVSENNETGIFTMAMDEPTGSDIENQLDSIFGNSAAASAPASAVLETAGADAFTPAMGEPTGEDIGDRLDVLFAEPDSVSSAAGNGEQDMVFFDSGAGMTNNSATPPASSIPTISETEDFAAGELLTDNGEPSGEDIENRLNSLFGEPFQTSIDDNDPILSNEQYDISAIMAEMNDGGNESASGAAVEQDVSGDDISSRIDELFAKHGDGSAAPDFSGFDMSDDGGQMLAAENDSALLNFNYTENVDSEINNLIAAAHDSPNNSQPDFAQNNRSGSIEDSAYTLTEPLPADSLLNLQESSEQTVIESAAQGSTDTDVVSGDDIEARLTGLFSGEDAAAPSDDALQKPAADFEEPLIKQPVGDSIADSNDKVFHNENAFTGELIDTTDAESNLLIDTSEQPFEIDGDDVQEKIRQLFKSGVSETEIIDTGASFGESEIDERDADAALELPDHVLTPTLADIYFQQGQPKLSLQIYERLSLRDPKDNRLQAKIQEIKDFLDSESNASDESTKKKTR